MLELVLLCVTLCIDLLISRGANSFAPLQLVLNIQKLEFLLLTKTILHFLKQILLFLAGRPFLVTPNMQLSKQWKGYNLHLLLVLLIRFIWLA